MNDNMIEWIKCVDEMPPMHDEVLVILLSGSVHVASLWSDYNFYLSTDVDNYLSSVVAWARINKPEF